MQGYYLYYSKQDTKIEVKAIPNERGNWMYERMLRECQNGEIYEHNSCYYLSSNKYAIDEKAEQIKWDWECELLNELNKVKDIKLNEPNMFDDISINQDLIREIKTIVNEISDKELLDTHRLSIKHIRQGDCSESLRTTAIRGTIDYLHLIMNDYWWCYKKGIEPTKRGEKERQKRLKKTIKILESEIKVTEKIKEEQNERI